MLSFRIVVRPNFSTSTHFVEVSGTSVSALNKISCLNSDLIAFMLRRSKNTEKKGKT